jgi:uncharacterized membrane protein
MRGIGSIFSALRALGTARLLGLLFLGYGVFGSVMLSLAVPPLQMPDETAHAMRAAHVADGHVFGEVIDVPRGDGTMVPIHGGMIDPALVATIQSFMPLVSRPDRRATAAMWQPPLPWSSERVRTVAISTMYPPPFYLPQAAAVGIGRAAGWTVVNTLTAARIANALCAAVLGALAIALAGGAAVWLFAVLTLPMSLSCLTTGGPDALMLACSALAAALAGQGLRTGAGERGALAWLVLLLSLVITIRPAYLGLALVPLALGGLSWRRRLAGGAIVLAAGLGWSALVSGGGGMPKFGAFQGADPNAQIALLLSEPWRVPAIAQATLEQLWLAYAYTFVGVLGWLDTFLPPAYYRAAGIMLAAAAVATVLGGTRMTCGRFRPLWILAAVVLSLGGIFGILYLTWTPPGQAIVHGVQGRYFLPLALLLGAALPSFALARLAPLRHALVGGVAAFSILSLGVTLNAVIARYYLS